MTAPADADDFESLLAAYCERIDAGESLTPEQFAHECRREDQALLQALTQLRVTMGLLPLGDCPKAIGSYRLEERIGRGAYGEVFGVCDANGRRLALKRLLPHVGTNPRAMERLRREGEILVGLRDPGIVRVVGVETIDGMPAVVMERVEGPSLADLLGRACARVEAGGPELAIDFRELPGAGSGWQRAVRLVAALARSLATAHSRGVLHRDLKPGNVRLRTDGTPVLLDFGLALDPDAATLTATGDLLGTPNYMSPEQANGRDVGAAADVYGLGAILHALVTGRPPHDARSPLEALAAARRGPPRPVRSLAPSVPRSVDAVLRRALAHRVESRWEDAAAFGAALEAVADGRPGPHLPLRQRLSEWWYWNRRKVAVVAVLGIAAVTAVATIQANHTTRVARAVAAFTALCTAELDDDGPARSGALSALQGTEHEKELVAWLGGKEPADPFLVRVASARAQTKSEPRNAVATLTQCVAERPDLAFVGALLGLAARAADQKELAERELTAASRRLPNSIRLHLELADLHRSRGNHAQAVASLRSALELQGDGDPQKAMTWSRLARSQCESGAHDDGLVSMARAKQLHGDAKVPVQWLRIEAALLDGAGRKGEAADVATEVCRRAPSAANWINCGRIHDGLHRMQEAAMAYRSALELEPRSESAAFHLAFLLAGSKRAECSECAQFFSAHPEYLDAPEVERLSLLLLDLQSPAFELAVAVAELAVRVGRTDGLLARVEQALETELEAEALGRLVQARKLLRAK